MCADEQTDSLFPVRGIYLQDCFVRCGRRVQKVGLGAEAALYINKVLLLVFNLWEQIWESALMCTCLQSTSPMVLDRPKSPEVEGTCMCAGTGVDRLVWLQTTAKFQEDSLKHAKRSSENRSTCPWKIRISDVQNSAYFGSTNIVIDHWTLGGMAPN